MDNRLLPCLPPLETCGLRRTKKEYRDWVARGRSDAILAAKAEHMWMEVGIMERWKCRGFAKESPCSGSLFFDFRVSWQPHIWKEGAYEDYKRRLNRARLMEEIEAWKIQKWLYREQKTRTTS